MSDDVDEAADDVDDEVTVEELLIALERHGQRLKRLEVAVVELQMKGNPFVTASWLFAEADAGKAREAWEAFLDWVIAVRNHYQLQSGWLPECWLEHGAIVEELTAQWMAYLAAYAAGGPGPARWHDGWWNALMRIRTEWANGCQAGHKPEERPSPWEHEKVPVPQATSWVVHHPARTEWYPRHTLPRHSGSSERASGDESAVVVGD